jgi:N6-adenosine-specific RNA methylase IME4
VSRQLELFRHGPFVVTPLGLTLAKGHTPTPDQWTETFRYASTARSGLQWALGDLLLLSDNMGYDDAVVEEVVESTGFKRGTIHNIKAVARAFTKSQRSTALSWSHHALVAGFTEDERQDLLRHARRENLSWEELRAVTKDRRRANRVAAMTWPSGQHGVLLADCPWPREAGAAPVDRSTERHYPAMTIDELCALASNLNAVTAENAVLYLWVTSKVAVTGEAAQVMRQWGFDGRSTMVWIKDLQGNGDWARQRHEGLFIGIKGDMPPPDESLRPDSVLTAHRGLHAEKPVELYEIIERCYPGVPRLELFAKGEAREGWAMWGNALDLMVGGADRGIRLRQEAVPA